MASMTRPISLKMQACWRLDFFKQCMFISCLSIASLEEISCTSLFAPRHSIFVHVIPRSACQLVPLLVNCTCSTGFTGKNVVQSFFCRDLLLKGPPPGRPNRMWNVQAPKVFPRLSINGWFPQSIYPQLDIVFLVSLGFLFFPVSPQVSRFCCQDWLTIVHLWKDALFFQQNWYLYLKVWRCAAFFCSAYRFMPEPMSLKRTFC